ncbi:hypothetical protein [Allorhodopirellula heiligendammensis]|uniref:hypothetical protein n=1 Tax=Allorhodopirellula heiligendammensis TaxID=2714739 RepID=UPI0011B481AC|nr:hypothetical protein [Allorhodopirellula heiligendammensis]
MLNRSTEELKEVLGTAIARDMGSRDILDILPQAAAGRVATLMLGNSGVIRGTFDRSARSAQLVDEGQSDLVNLAVRETLRTGGQVVREHGDSTQVAAIYRF